MDFDQMVKNQDKFKGSFNCKAIPREFKQGDLVLMWDKRREKPGMHHNFGSLLLGPFKIAEKYVLDYFYMIRSFLVFYFLF